MRRRTSTSRWLATKGWFALPSAERVFQRRRALAAAGGLIAGGGFLLGIPAAQVRLTELAAVVAVAFATLAGLAKQASP